MTPRITIVIATRNRFDELARAIRSCFAQTGVPFEVLVIDDASDDDTAAAVARDFPQARLLSFPTRAGLIVRRNNGFREARGEFVLSLDDDAYFTSPDTLVQVCQLFDQEAGTAAWALQYFEPSSQAAMPATPTGTPVRSYVGCAHAIRRSVAEQMGGYPGLLVHQGEERDLCIRLIDQGWDVRFAQTPPIVHLCSVRREVGRIGYYGYRNLMLFNWMRTPTRYLIPRLGVDIAQLLIYRFSFRLIAIRLWSVACGFACMLKYGSERRPVSLAAYQKYRSLRGHGPSANPGSVTPPPCSLSVESAGGVGFPEACSRVEG